MDQFTITHVTATGATTRAYNDETRALSRYGLLKADPAVVYAHLAENDKIVKQFVRPVGSAETMDLTP